MFMIFKFNEWVEIDNVVEPVLEYMLDNYLGFYQDAYNKIYKNNMNKRILIFKMIKYLKSKGVGKKFALSFLASDIDTWLENKNVA